MSSPALVASAFDADAHFRISVMTMAGAAILIDDVSTADTIISVKHRVFAANHEMHVGQQRLFYRPGPRGMEPLADEETLGGAGVAQDGSAELDVFVVDLTEAETAALGAKLLDAAGTGRANDMRDLLDEGANIECKDHFGNTALIRAGGNSYADCVRLLLDAGADKEAIDNDGRTALMKAIQADPKAGNLDCVRLLINVGAALETKDKSGFNPLLESAKLLRSDCVRLLIDAGANKDIQHSVGWTPLIFAAEAGHSDCVRLLIDAGANLEAVDMNGKTALLNSAFLGRTECVRLLLDAGANTGVKDHSGQTALILAQRGPASDISDILRMLGADEFTVACGPRGPLDAYACIML